MISQEIRVNMAAQAVALGLEIIAVGGETCATHAGTTGTMIVADAEGDLRKIAAGAGLDIESGCPCPLDVFHGVENPRRSTRIGGTRKEWAGDISKTAGRFVLSVYGATA